MKNLVLLLFILTQTFNTSAQKPNWQNLDLQTDSVFGISTEKAYTELLNHKKKFKPVIVAVIDSGVDTAHEDLQSVIWINKKETPSNQEDDDHDGYADDIYGWNFIGGPGGNVNKETLEMTRLIRTGKGDPEMIADYNQQLNDNRQALMNIQATEKILDSMVLKMKKENPTRADFESYHPENDGEIQVRQLVINFLQKNPDYNAYRYQLLSNYKKQVDEHLNYSLNQNFNPRTIVGDDTLNATEHLYGNNDVTGPDALHGTHVAGIIGAVRDNGIGIQGIANHVWILSIRTVPSGDERDKDVANAIRYATDHGAQVINMSFGKGYSPDKKVVDDAVRYAMKKDVLLIHAAGNEGKNLDHEKNFPTRVYMDPAGEAGAWLEVGASGWVDDSTLVAPFSNYGKMSVDVFAPGTNIYSSIPGSKYINESGTSMAAPVVAGLAALIRSYYPKLTALQVKKIIMLSVVKPKSMIRVQDNGEVKTLLFSDVCISGGIVNAYQALMMAELNTTN